MAILAKILRPTDGPTGFLFSSLRFDAGVLAGFFVGGAQTGTTEKTKMRNVKQLTLNNQLFTKNSEGVRDPKDFINS